MVAEIADHLDEALLRGGGGKGATGSAAQQTLTREAKHGIVLGGGPRKITAFDGVLNTCVFAFRGASPEPGKHDVDGEISDARSAEKGLRSIQAGGTKRVMPRPKIVPLDLKGFEKRVCEGRVRNFSSAPAFQLLREIAGFGPTRRESQAALWMVHGTEAVKMPDIARENAI